MPAGPTDRHRHRASAYPFQVVLSVAAVWVLGRFALNRGDWVKTVHQGTHLRVTQAQPLHPAMAEDLS